MSDLQYANIYGPMRLPLLVLNPGLLIGAYAAVPVGVSHGHVPFPVATGPADHWWCFSLFRQYPHAAFLYGNERRYKYCHTRPLGRGFVLWKLEHPT